MKFADFLGVCFEAVYQYLKLSSVQHQDLTGPQKKMSSLRQNTKTQHGKKKKQVGYMFFEPYRPPMYNFLQSLLHTTAHNFKNWFWEIHLLLSTYSNRESVVHSSKVETQHCNVKCCTYGHTLIIFTPIKCDACHCGGPTCPHAHMPWAPLFSLCCRNFWVHYIEHRFHTQNSDTKIKSRQ